MIQYLEIKIAAIESVQEILVAELAEMQYEGFVHEPDCLIAYIPETDFRKNDLESLLLQTLGKIDFELTAIVNQNWNEQWEKNFEPISIRNQVYIRALFHPAQSNCKYIITIQPKMSFGTGHHATTQLMIEKMLTINFKGKRVLDMGTGTAVLAILAKQLGATMVLAIDNDEWAINNANENIGLNHLMDIEVKLGDEKIIQNEQPFDIILSNITKNYNLQNIPLYARLLPADGHLFMSGFYDTDVAEIEQMAIDNGLKIQDVQRNNAWSVVQCNKGGH